jgi:hypothetical protein
MQKIAKIFKNRAKNCSNMQFYPKKIMGKIISDAWCRWFARGASNDFANIKKQVRERRNFGYANFPIGYTKKTTFPSKG